MQRVFLVGRDDRLISTRSQVLATMNVEVVYSIPAQLEVLDEADNFDLTYLCSSLAVEEQRSIAVQVRKRFPKTCIVQIKGLRNSNSNKPDYADATMSWNPHTLVVESKRLLLHIAAEAAPNA